MVNNDRIVPIQKIDLLSMYGTILTFIHLLQSNTLNILAASSVEGDFSVTGSGSAGSFLANQPVKTLDFPEAVTGATVYFVPAYDFSAITVAGAAATIGDSGIALADIQPDGVTLYGAVLSSGEVNIMALTPSLASA